MNNKKLPNEVIQYHVNISACAYYEKVFDLLSAVIPRTQLAQIHTTAKANVKKQLIEANLQS